MLSAKSLGKDHYGALLLISLGSGTLKLGLGYETGTLNRMGAGFIPAVLGSLLILVGIVLGISAVLQDGETVVHAQPCHSTHEGPEWRGWLCILGGVVAFVVLGDHGGLLPATFASVFISAMGDRNNTVKGAALLGVVLTLFCLIVFHYGLKLQLPLFQWT